MEADGVGYEPEDKMEIEEKDPDLEDDFVVEATPLFDRVEIDHVDPGCASHRIALGQFDRVNVVERCLVEVAVFKTNNLAVHKFNLWVNNHGVQSPQRSPRPRAALFPRP